MVKISIRMLFRWSNKFKTYHLVKPLHPTTLHKQKQYMPFTHGDLEGLITLVVPSLNVEISCLISSSYCDNCTRPRLKELSTQLLRDLDRFQKRAFAKNEIKARAHPRLVLGVREALARLRINKVKLLFLATDCEICPGESE